MKNKILGVFAVFLLVIIQRGYAQEKFPIKIESDSVKYYGKEQYSLFSGNVRATYKDAKIYSDEIKVQFDAKKDVDIIFANGNVKLVKENMYSLSKNAEFKVKESMLVLKGDAKVWQGENYLEGEEVIVYNDDNKVLVNKSSNKRVKVIFYPEEKERMPFAGNKDNESKKDIQKKSGGK